MKELNSVICGFCSSTVFNNGTVYKPQGWWLLVPHISRLHERCPWTIHWMSEPWPGWLTKGDSQGNQHFLLYKDHWKIWAWASVTTTAADFVTPSVTAVKCTVVYKNRRVRPKVKTQNAWLQQWGDPVVLLFFRGHFAEVVCVYLSPYRKRSLQVKPIIQSFSYNLSLICVMMSAQSGYIIWFIASFIILSFYNYTRRLPYFIRKSNNPTQKL